MLYRLIIYLFIFNAHFSSSVAAPQHSGFVPYRHTHKPHFTGARFNAVAYYAARLRFSTKRVSTRGGEQLLSFSYSIWFSRNIPRFPCEMLGSTSSLLDPTQWPAQ